MPRVMAIWELMADNLPKSLPSPLEKHASENFGSGLPCPPGITSPRRLARQIVIARAAGIAIHKRTVMAAIQTPAGRQRPPFGTMTRDLERLEAWPREQGVTQVAMEGTGIYWQPVYDVPEERPLELLVVNAQHFKAVPDRKTDVKDAERPAELLRYGLVGGLHPGAGAAGTAGVSPLPRDPDPGTGKRDQPPPETPGRGSHQARPGGDRPAGGISGRQMLAALIAGEEYPTLLADLARGRLRRKHNALGHALIGKLGVHQAILAVLLQPADGCLSDPQDRGGLSRPGGRLFRPAAAGGDRASAGQTAPNVGLPRHPGASCLIRSSERSEGCRMMGSVRMVRASHSQPGSPGFDA